MLRLSSRQALKAPQNPLRNLPSLRGRLQLHNATLLHHTLPFSGPPSYATIARRWSSSNPSPISLLAKEKNEEAKKRGEFVDIHDVVWDDFSDMDSNTLHSDISKLVGIPYLMEATKDEADKVVTSIQGFVYGQLFRSILPCVLSIGGMSRWIFFLVTTGSPLTYISAEVSCFIPKNTQPITQS
jgi:hypothetical protein